MLMVSKNLKKSKRYLKTGGQWGIWKVGGLPKMPTHLNSRPTSLIPGCPGILDEGGKGG